MSSVLVRHYVTRAADYYDSMWTLLRLSDSQSSPALLAIHSAISYADALRTGLGDEKLYADDHTVALARLRELLVKRKHSDESGLIHLRFLLSVKSAACYGPKRLDAREFNRITTKAEQFAAWATRTGTQLRLEGWRHDDQ